MERLDRYFHANPLEKRAYVTTDGSVFPEKNLNDARAHQSDLNRANGKQDKVAEHIAPKFAGEVKKTADEAAQAEDLKKAGEVLEAAKQAVELKEKELALKEELITKREADLEEREAALKMKEEAPLAPAAAEGKKK